MFTNAKLALCVAAVLGSASAARTAPQRPTIRQIESSAQHQVSRSAPGDDMSGAAAAGISHARPIHSSSVQADSRLIASKNRSQRHPARLRQEWTTHRLFYSFNFGVEWVSYQT